MKKIKDFIVKNKVNIVLIIISIIAFIIGTIGIGWLYSLVIVAILDFLLFVLPNILDKKKEKNTNQTKKYKASDFKKIKSESKHDKTITIINKNDKGKKKDGLEKKKKTGLEKKKKRKAIWKWILIAFFALAIVGIIAVSLLFYLIAKDAPAFDPEKLYTQEATILYDSDGNIITKLGAQKREKISYDQLPEVLVNAIVATEDANFFKHNGVDIKRLLVATVKQALGDSSAGGASTLTMQLAKNSYTSSIRQGVEGFKRKLTDIYISMFMIEDEYSKEEILEFYVNSYLLGSGSYGVEQASQTYFGKSVSEINLSEAAMLAGLFQAPTRYSPLINPESAAARRTIVLKLMERHGYITEEERLIADSIPIEELIKNASTDNGDEYQSFIDTVVEQVKEETGQDPYSVPMEIYTTMNRSKQNHVNKIMSGESFNWENDVVQAGIMVLDTKTGAIVAVGAGRNRTGANSYNRATMISRQIGSTAKPLYDYGPGIEYNHNSTYTVIADEEYTYSDGNKLYNWDGKYYGLVTSRTALAQSRNIPAVKMFKSVDNASIRKFVTSLGLHPEEYLHEAHAIGGYNGESPLSMAAAYAAFGNNGTYNEPYSFTKVVYRDTGESFTHKSVSQKAMSSETAYMVSDMLITTSKVAVGAYSYINGYSYAAKSGTSNFDDKTKAANNLSYDAINDLWLVGYTDQYTISVWYGYDKIDSAHYSHFGNNTNAALFNAVAKGVFERSMSLNRPNTVVSVTVESGTIEPKLPSAYTPNDLKVTELFISGYEPTKVSTRFSQLSNISNLNTSTSGGIVYLSWDKVDTPDAINKTWIENYFKQVFTNTNHLNGAVNERIAYNNANIGTIVYDIYEKAEDGTLTFIDSTANNSIVLNSNKVGQTTYVVKTAYSIFKSNASAGKSATVDLNSSEPIITATLNGNESVNINTLEEYSDPLVTVNSNGIDITSLATIVTSVYNNGTYVGTSVPLTSGTYKITYDVTYKTFTKKLQRTVTRTLTQ